jgi:hypothetical protein
VDPALYAGLSGGNLQVLGSNATLISAIIEAVQG